MHEKNQDWDDRRYQKLHDGDPEICPHKRRNPPCINHDKECQNGRRHQHTRHCEIPLDRFSLEQPGKILAEVLQHRNRLDRRCRVVANPRRPTEDRTGYITMCEMGQSRDCPRHRKNTRRLGKAERKNQNRGATNEPGDD